MVQKTTDVGTKGCESCWRWNLARTPLLSNLTCIRLCTLYAYKTLARSSKCRNCSTPTHLGFKVECWGSQPGLLLLLLLLLLQLQLQLLL